MLGLLKWSVKTSNAEERSEKMADSHTLKMAHRDKINSPTQSTGSSEIASNLAKWLFTRDGKRLMLTPRTGGYSI